MRSVDSNSTVTFYEGPQNAERVVRKEYDFGLVSRYKGPKLHERLVREEWTKGRVRGEVWHFEGKRREEHLVRIEFPDGTIVSYTGPRGEEVESNRSTAAKRKEAALDDYLMYNSTLSSYD